MELEGLNSSLMVNCVHYLVLIGLLSEVLEGGWGSTIYGYYCDDWVQHQMPKA